MADGDQNQEVRPGKIGGARTTFKTTDSHSPYYLHPSDDPRRILVTSLMNGDNYHTWRRAMQNALYDKNNARFVDGTVMKPAATSLDVAYAETAREILSDLQERFTRGNASRAHELKLELATLTKQTRSVVAYFTKLKPLWDKLKAYEPISVCTCGATREYTKAQETEKVHQFLMELNENFSVTLSQILSMEPLPSLNKVYAMVTKEEKQQAVVASRSSTVEATTFAAKTNTSA
ncbi:hypothetical protein SLEP1_g38471 [Rubroshorea leprosula]|nr:hypothetical protein SLEP1_g38471 [Rubroshorea leprosula]